MTTSKYLILATLIASSASVSLAGPGIQAWQSRGKPAALSSDATKPTPIICPDAETVPVTVMKHSWPNARGPLVEVQVGTKQVCKMCPVTEIQTTRATPRGPLARQESAKVGAAHDCAAAGCTMGSKT
jgi:propanediol dehydratase large subunit